VSAARPLIAFDEINKFCQWKNFLKRCIVLTDSLGHLHVQQIDLHTEQMFREDFRGFTCDQYIDQLMTLSQTVLQQVGSLVKLQQSSQSDLCVC
jgi:hypothetical protein